MTLALCPNWTELVFVDPVIKVSRDVGHARSIWRFCLSTIHRSQHRAQKTRNFSIYLIRFEIS